MQVDSWGLEEFSIDGHIVTLGLNHSGGCGEHDFDLYMTPAAFMESFPVQANLYLRHKDHDDPCDAIVTRQLHFDIDPILNLYQKGYGQLDPIWLHLYEYYEGSSPGRRLSVLYQPDADGSAITIPESAPGQ